MSTLRTYAHLADLESMIGQEIAVSDWIEIDQHRIDAFAQCTGDFQWIHLDAARAAEGPFGTTVAHGFLTLSLLPALGTSAMKIEDVKVSVNYGLNKVRFPAPVPVGSRLRARLTLLSYDKLANGAQMVVNTTIEREGQDKPVCVAEAVSRRFTV